MTLSTLHRLSTWTPAGDSFEDRLDQMHVTLDRIGQRLDRLEAGVDAVQASTDHILVLLRGGAR